MKLGTEVLAGMFLDHKDKLDATLTIIKELTDLFNKFTKLESDLHKKLSSPLTKVERKCWEN